MLFKLSFISSEIAGTILNDIMLSVSTGMSRLASLWSFYFDLSIFGRSRSSSATQDI